jgi:hypothetical protein
LIVGLRRIRSGVVGGEVALVADDVKNSGVDRASDSGEPQKIDGELLAKVLVACALALYVLGLIAVNGYLFFFDVTDFTVIRTRFIYTGALLVTLGVVPYMFLRSYLPKSIKELKELCGKGWFGLILACILVPAAISLLVPIIGRLVTGHFSHYHEWPRVWEQAVIAVFPAYLVGLIFCAIANQLLLPPLRGVAARISGAGTAACPTDEDVKQAETSANQKSDGTLSGSVEGLRGVIVTLFLVLIYTVVFMLCSYPRIPEQFGGGRPSNVRFLFKEASVPGAKELSIPLCKKTRNLSSKLSLIYETTDSYIIKLGPTNAHPELIVRINKDMVSAAITKRNGDDDESGDNC